jgi:hypothetical protein
MDSLVKNLAGHIPGAATLYDALRPRRPRTRYNLEQLGEKLPASVEEARPYAAGAKSGSRLVLFATLHYWIEQAAIVGLVLRAMGHEVTIAYLPYSNWDKETNRLDLQRQDLYTRRVLAPLEGLLKIQPLLDFPSPKALPEPLAVAVQTASEYDVMYSLQTEDVDRDAPLFRLRLRRNAAACRAALAYLGKYPADAVLIPNGLVTELGAFYQTSRHLELPTVTYEFNDQREQIWLAQNDVVMRQNTDALWQARGALPLTEVQVGRIRDFEAAREGALTYAKGTRRWQDTPREGSDALRARLGLDGRPIVLLATNVLGDSLTLGRNVFAASMAEWIEKTVAYFVARRDVQLVIRIHPGERLIKGPSILRVIEAAAPGKPDHIHVIGPAEKTNTYDVMVLAQLGLAYTTTVGLEMAMRGIPVIVAGKTHYRDRGFTIAPESWDEYFGLLDSVLRAPASHALTAEQRDAAWNYGYRFFFEYPYDFPWRLMHFWKDMGEWPVGRVLSDEGRTAFGRTFDHLSGDRIEWSP